MTVTTLFAMLCGIMGTIFAISPILQIRRTLRAKSSANVSLGFMAVSICNFTCWGTYGVLIGSIPIWGTNGLAIVVACVNLGVAWCYRPDRAVPLYAELARG
jgi:MtN3 and saliva related transmembrane protein